MHIELTEKRRKRVRDFVLYIVISLAIAGTLVALALSDIKEDVVLKLYFFSLYTLVGFGYCIQKCWALRRRNFFWTFLSCAFFLHCSIFWAIFTRIKEPKGDWIASAIAEAAALIVVAKWLLRTTPTPQ